MNFKVMSSVVYMIPRLKTTHMMEEGGSDIVQMPKKSEEAAPQLVVPYLLEVSIK